MVEQRLCNASCSYCPVQYNNPIMYHKQVVFAIPQMQYTLGRICYCHSSRQNDDCTFNAFATALAKTVFSMTPPLFMFFKAAGLAKHPARCSYARQNDDCTLTTTPMSDALSIMIPQDGVSIHQQPSVYIKHGAPCRGHGYSHMPGQNDDCTCSAFATSLARIVSFSTMPL